MAVALAPGQVVADRYRVIGPLDAGGMGVLYEVESTKIGRRFALKTIKGGLVNEPEALARFRREADIIAKLNHPHIVSIVDWDALDDGAPFFVMELLVGEDLSERLSQGPLDWPTIGQVASQAMSAVAEAHRHGVLHRDLKPANLFLRRVSSGVHVKVLDFGLARSSTAPAITNYSHRQMLGTPAYMSPEQIEGTDKIGAESDVWAMGAILYEMATGRAAFSGSLQAIVVAVQNRRPVPLRVLREDASIAFADAVEAAMSRVDSRRIKSIAELSERIGSALEGRSHDSHLASSSSASMEYTVPVAAIERTESAAPIETANSDIATRLDKRPLMGHVLRGEVRRHPGASSPQPGPAQSRRRLWLWAALLAVVAGAVVAWGLAQSGSETPPAKESVVDDGPVAQMASDASAVGDGPVGQMASDASVPAPEDKGEPEAAIARGLDFQVLVPPAFHVSQEGKRVVMFSDKSTAQRMITVFGRETTVWDGEPTAADCEKVAKHNLGKSKLVESELLTIGGRPSCRFHHAGSGMELWTTSLQRDDRTWFVSCTFDGPECKEVAVGFKALPPVANAAGEEPVPEPLPLSIAEQCERDPSLLVCPLE